MAARLATFVLALTLVAATGANAITIGYRPRTGDLWIDTHLSDINRYGRLDREYFIDDVVASFGAPRYFVRDLLLTRRWEPADVYYACALAHRLNQPCVDIVRDYGDDRGEGWGAIARRMGIQPGSAEFHTLKGELVRVDDRYRQHFPKAARPVIGDHGMDRHDGAMDAGRTGPVVPPPARHEGKGKDKDKGGKPGKGHGR